MKLSEIDKYWPLLEAIRAGKTLQIKNKYDDRWYVTDHSDFRYPVESYRIHKEFPALPAGEEWHNPLNLKAEQIPEGKRLLLKSEVNSGNPELKGHLFFRYSEYGEPLKNYLIPGFSLNPSETYYTTLPFPTKKVKVDYVYTVEVAPISEVKSTVYKERDDYDD